MAIKLTWVNHATHRLEGSATVYIDPWKLDAKAPKADVIFISHSHYDHLSAEDVSRIATEETDIVAASDCLGTLEASGRLHSLTPGDKIELQGVLVEGVRGPIGPLFFGPVVQSG